MASHPPFAGDGSFRAALARGVHARAFEGEMILLDSATGDYFALNDVGQSLVQSLEDGYSLEECAERLHETFDVEWHVLCSDVLHLCTELMSRKLIVPRASGPAALEAQS
jgi:hypothetical protein